MTIQFRSALKGLFASAVFCLPIVVHAQTENNQQAEVKVKAKANQAEAKEESQKPKIQLAILLDTSGSMSGLINQARTQLWKIVNEFATAKQNGLSPEIRVALYEYGKDSLPGNEGYLRMIVPFTDDLDKVSEELFALTTNGGSEYCGMVIDQATRELQWSNREADMKCIFIAGNEPFTQGPVKFQDACGKAIQKGITINTIFCGNHAAGVQSSWEEGAKLADGSFISIDHNQKVPVIAAPQDKQLAELSAKLNKTFIAYGAADKRKAAVERQVEQDNNAANANPAVAASRAQLKGSAYYSNASWDILDACRTGKIKLEDLTEDQLPEELKKMKPEERKAYVESKAKERKQIQEEIKTLSAKRNVYIAEESKKLNKDGKNSLDEAILNAARTQAKKKNFKFEK